MVALTVGESPALGNIWRITAKTTDFYLDPLGEAGTVAHLSVHGPNERFNGHRFHIKVDRWPTATTQDQRYATGHTIPRKGFAFDGQQLAAQVFRVARIRWTWDLQRHRFRAAAISGSPHRSTTIRWVHGSRTFCRHTSHGMLIWSSPTRNHTGRMRAARCATTRAQDRYPTTHDSG